MSGEKVSDWEIREKVKSAAIGYYHYKYVEKKPFEPGDRISYGGRVFDEKEITNLIDASLDFWLTTGKYSKQFEKKILRIFRC